MAFRNIIIESPAQISLKNKQLIIKTDSTHSVAVEDISALLIESRASSITAAALSHLGQSGCAVFICDEKHLPCAVLEPFSQHSRALGVLKAQLEAAKNCRIKLIATDGVFSMDGYIANLPAICDLADEYGALVMVDDSHAVGFMGEHGRGTAEACGVMGRVDIVTGTLGKALGGASGGYTCAKKDIIDLLRQRSRPYLFSNALAPAICAASLKVLEMLTTSTALRDKVHENTAFFRSELGKLGFDVLPGTHPIVPVMLYDARTAQEFAARMLEKGVYVIGFCYPVVPMGKARIRTQVSAGHSKEDLEFAVKCFKEVKEEMGL